MGPGLAERNSSPSWLMVAPTREDGSLALTRPAAAAGRVDPRTARSQGAKALGSAPIAGRSCG